MVATMERGKPKIDESTQVRRAVFRQPENDGPVRPTVREVGSDLWWLGLSDDAPVQSVSLGGYSCPRETQRLHQPEGSLRTQRIPQRGALYWLTSERVERIRRAANARVVRWVGETSQRGEVRVKDDPRYRPMTTDVPIARYIYFLRAEEAQQSLGPQWQSGLTPPPTLA